MKPRSVRPKLPALVPPMATLGAALSICTGVAVGHGAEAGEGAAGEGVVLQGEQTRDEHSAATVAGPLQSAGTISRLVLHREQRISVTPAVLATLDERFWNQWFATAHVAYHPLDQLGLGFIAGYGSPGWRTEAAELLALVTQGPPPRLTQIEGFVVADLSLVPLHGKFGLFDQIMWLDIPVFVGAGAVFLDEAQAGHEAAFGVSFGTGVTLFVTEYLSMGFTYRALTYPRARVTGEDTTWAPSHMLGAALGLWLPVDAKRECRFTAP